MIMSTSKVMCWIMLIRGCMFFVFISFQEANVNHFEKIIILKIMSIPSNIYEPRTGRPSKTNKHTNNSNPMQIIEEKKINMYPGLSPTIARSSQENKKWKPNVFAQIRWHKRFRSLSYQLKTRLQLERQPTKYSTCLWPLHVCLWVCMYECMNVRG